MGVTTVLPGQLCSAGRALDMSVDAFGLLDVQEAAEPAEDLRGNLGGRWLTAGGYRMGDALVFTMATVHGALDSHRENPRLSSDSRYQLASEPVAHRWVGDKTMAHGMAPKRGRIC